MVEFELHLEFEEGEATASFKRIFQAPFLPSENMSLRFDYDDDQGVLVEQVGYSFIQQKYEVIASCDLNDLLNAFFAFPDEWEARSMSKSTEEKIRQEFKENAKIFETDSKGRILIKDIK